MTTIRHLSSRIVARGYNGYADPLPFTFDVTANRRWRQAVSAVNSAATGTGGNPPQYGVRNLRRLRDRAAQDDDGDRRSGGIASTPAIILNYSLSFDSSQNATSAWTDTRNGGQYFVATNNPYRGETMSLLNAVNLGSKPANYVSAWSIPANAAWSIRVCMTRPADGVAWPIWGLRWGGWQFSLQNGRPQIAQLSSAWTAGKEATLQSEAGDDPGLRAEIYTNWQELDLHNGQQLTANQESWYGSPFILTFLPEPRGLLNIILEGGSDAAIEVKSILDSRASGTLWHDTPLTMFNNGGAFWWQTGYPSFAGSGQMSLGDLWGDSASLGQAISNTLSDTSQGGTVQVSINTLQTGDGYTRFQPIAELTSSNNRYTPFLYSSQLAIPGGPRNGDTDVIWDSIGYWDSGGNPIVDIRPQFENDRALATRRICYEVEARESHGALQLPGGAALSAFAIPGTYYEALENRVVSLFADDPSGTYANPILQNGIVTRAQIGTMKSATAGQSETPTAVMRGETRVLWTICDRWAILDDDLMTDDPIGDGQYLGAYLRTLLLNAGERDGNVFDHLPGVSATAGRILPQAAPGETPCVRPAKNVSRGEYIRSMVDKYGMGWTLYYKGPTSTWTFAQRRTGPPDNPIQFSGDSSRNSVGSYPGRYAILRPLDMARDFADVYTHFRVEGALATNGSPQVAEYCIAEAFATDPDTYPGPAFIGRIRRYPTVRDEGLRTPSDVNFVCRSLALQYGRPGRFIAFETFFHYNLYPGMWVQVDGVNCTIERIAGGSSLHDRMQLVCREYIPISLTALV